MQVRQRFTVLAVCCVWSLEGSPSPAAEPPRFEREIAPLLQTHCVKCHGPAKREGGLDLSTSAGIARGGKRGAAIAPHDAPASRLWERVESDEMPPEEPLEPAQKEVLKQWIIAGAPGLPSVNPESANDADHWAFRKLSPVSLPAVRDALRFTNGIDQFVQSSLEKAGLAMSPEADRPTLIRRVALDLTGLPPTLAELDAFLEDDSGGAYARMVERYLASPHYGERWGKFWLDAAGYADSNGYFNADSDRPLAYRYRDWVVRALNADRPFDRFVREQLAGDELAGYRPGDVATPEIIALLEASHFLRNSQDGSGESDGNPEEVRIDRYTALEGAMQNTASALLGLTIQCAKCHSHKFEPISHEDYYRWQAIFYPCFNIEQWIKPNDRVVYAPPPGEHERWEVATRELGQRVAAAQAELNAWVRAHRPRGEVQFEDTFDHVSGTLAARWSAIAPGDDAPAGTTPVQVDGDTPPAAHLRDDRLHVMESGGAGNRWLSTRQSFDWTPDAPGESIQATFDLIDNRLTADGQPAERIGYYIALCDYDDSGTVAGGNVLIDGHPGGGTTVHLDYPGDDSRAAGVIGATGYAPGHNYGVRVTNLGEGRFRLEHLVDGAPEEKPLDLAVADLPDGGFGFEFCCGRSFVVDNVQVERFPAASGEDASLARFHNELKERREALARLTAEQRALAEGRPGKIAWTTEMSGTVPEVRLLERGNYSTPGAVVQPATLSVLDDASSPFAIPSAAVGATTSGRRLAWANWLTTPGSRAASLLARVQVNRIWQQHFGTGIAATSDNLGLSGAPPSHPELLEWLAGEFVRSGWSVKDMHRLIVGSTTYRQRSALRIADLGLRIDRQDDLAADEAAPGTDSNPKSPILNPQSIDPDNRLLWRFPVRRLDAEAIRDSMLAVSGDLNSTIGGPYIPTTRTGSGEVVVDETAAGARRRSLYLYQRRTQVLSFLAVFDAPTIVFNSVRRGASTMPLQSLSLLNSEFAVARAQSLATRLRALEPDETLRAALAFRLLLARDPSRDEVTALLGFVESQTHEYAADTSPRERAWLDLCQSLLASSQFLYVE